VRLASKWKASVSIIFCEIRLDSLHGKNGLHIPVNEKGHSYVMVKDIVG